MHINYHALIGAAVDIPINSPRSIISFSPVLLPVPGRPVDLQLRVTIPSTSGNNALPIILLSHGQGRSNSLSSLEGYAPLAEFWAAHGYAVLQPTHLSSAFLGLKAPAGQELFWQERAKDMVRILDNLDVIEAVVSELTKGRLDRTRVAVAGHSAGGWTAAMLLGASNMDPRDNSTWHKPEVRIRAGIILAGIGNGGADVSDFGKQLIPFYGADFSTMIAPALVVYGDEDVGPLSTRGADWRADPYALAPGPKDLLVLKGAKHGLGGISGWDAGETLDESPERLAVVQRMTLAYLRSQLFEEEEDGDGAWGRACRAFEGLEGLGRVEGKT